jgi:hypothetical protein
VTVSEGTSMEILREEVVKLVEKVSGLEKKIDGVLNLIKKQSKEKKTEEEESQEKRERVQLLFVFFVSF